jgi:hypothetical protein
MPSSKLRKVGLRAAEGFRSRVEVEQAKPSERFGDETATEGLIANPRVQERPENTKLLYIL